MKINILMIYIKEVIVQYILDKEAKSGFAP